MKLIFTKMHGLGNDYIFITQARNPNLTVSDGNECMAFKTTY